VKTGSRKKVKLKVLGGQWFKLAHKSIKHKASGKNKLNKKIGQIIKMLGKRKGKMINVYSKTVLCSRNFSVFALLLMPRAKHKPNIRRKNKNAK